MIYLTPGTTASIWLSLRESIPVGVGGDFKFTFTNDISGDTKVFYPLDLQPSNKWSKFNLIVDTPEDLPSSKLDMRAGMWSYKVEVSDVTLETGKVLVEEGKTWTTLKRPAKNIKTLKR